MVLFLLLYVFVLVWAADSGAYFAGRALVSTNLPESITGENMARRIWWHDHRSGISVCIYSFLR